MSIAHVPAAGAALARVAPKYGVLLVMIVHNVVRVGFGLAGSRVHRGYRDPCSGRQPPGSTTITPRTTSIDTLSTYCHRADKYILRGNTAATHPVEQFEGGAVIPRAWRNGHHIPASPLKPDPQLRYFSLAIGWGAYINSCVCWQGRNVGVREAAVSFPCCKDGVGPRTVAISTTTAPLAYITGVNSSLTRWMNHCGVSPALDTVTGDNMRHVIG